MGFRHLRALSGALAALGTPQPGALGSLNPVFTLYTVSSYYVEAAIASYTKGVLLHGIHVTCGTGYRQFISVVTSD